MNLKLSVVGLLALAVSGVTAMAETSRGTNESDGLNRDSSGRPISVEVTLEAADWPSKILMAWSDGRDYGSNLTDWPHIVALGIVAADETSATLDIPPEIGKALDAGGMYRIFRMKADAIPDAAYAVIDYLEADGKQSINTGFVPGAATSCTIDMSPSAVGSSQNNYFFASRSTTMGSATAAQSFFEMNLNKDGLFYLCMHDAFSGSKSDTSFANSGVTAVKDARYTCVADAATPKFTIEKDGVVTDCTSKLSDKRVTKKASDALYLFGSTVLGNTMFRGKFYSCQITDGEASVRDLVPCVRLSDGVLGVYDLSGTSENPFYGNVGTADFPNAAEAWAGVDTSSSAAVEFKPSLFVANVVREAETPVAVDVEIPASDVLTKVFVAWSAKGDCGTSIAAWDGVAELGDIPAQTRQLRMAIPASVQAHLKGAVSFRLFKRVSGVIPDAAYAEIAYLETDGKQSINTGFVPGAATSCTVDMSPSVAGSSAKEASQNYFFASRSTTMGSATAEQSFFEMNLNKNGLFYLCMHNAFSGSAHDNSFANSGVTAIKDARYTCVADAATPKFTIEKDGVVTDCTSKLSGERVTKKACDSLYLFGSTLFAGTMFCGKFYSCQITDGGETVRDLVPCVRLSDGALGVYDLSGASASPFYGNVGTADFPNAAEAWAGVDAIASACVHPDVRLSVVRLTKEAGLPLSADIVYPASTELRTLWFVWDSHDKGKDVSKWGNSAQVCEIAPGTISATIDIPVAAREFLKACGGFRLELEPIDRLPCGYSEIVYLETDGHQSINTGFVPGAATSCTVDLSPSVVGTAQNYFFASRTTTMASATSAQSFFEMNLNNSGLFYLCMHDAFSGSTRDNSFANSGVSAVKDARYTCVADAATPKFTIEKDGVVTDCTSKLSDKRVTKKASDALYLFGSTLFAGTMFCGKFYSCQITDGGETVRDLVPCVRRGDGALGVYDLSGASENPFYGNVGTADFVNAAEARAGLSDKTVSDYVRVIVRGLIIVVE